MDEPDVWCRVSRDKKSLNCLAKKFVDMMKNAENGVLNLRMVSDMLDVRQKRRIYDITNVLEGIGLIHKKSKNCVQWKEFQPTESKQQVKLALELRKWTEHERYLDKMCKWAQQNLKNCMSDREHWSLSYVTRDDLVACFEEDVVLAAKGTCKVERLPTLEGNALIYGRGLRLTTAARPIEVFLVTDDGHSLVQTDPNATDECDPATSSNPTPPPLPPPPNASNHHSANNKTTVAATTSANNAEKRRPPLPSYWNLNKKAAEKDALQSWQEYKNTANILLNYRVKNPAMLRRKRLRNFYQAKPPLIKLSDSLANSYMFALSKHEGITDLFDIPLGLARSASTTPAAAVDEEAAAAECMVVLEEEEEEVEEFANQDQS